MPELSQAEFGLLRHVGQGFYDRGFVDGQNDAMRKLIPIVRKLGGLENEPGARGSNKAFLSRAGRAPRGTVTEFITKLLTKAPGQGQRDIESAALDEEDISPTSIGNELRRNEGTRYVKDEQKRWFVILREQNQIADRQRYPNPAAEHSIDTSQDRAEERLLATFAALLRESNAQNANTADEGLND